MIYYLDMNFMSGQVGAAEITVRVVDDLKDENEQYRKMVMETIEQILTNMGATDIDNRLEEQLIDGMLLRGIIRCIYIV